MLLNVEWSDSEAGLTQTLSSAFDTTPPTVITTRCLSSLNFVVSLWFQFDLKTRTMRGWAHKDRQLTGSRVSVPVRSGYL